MGRFWQVIKGQSSAVVDKMEKATFEATVKQAIVELTKKLNIMVLNHGKAENNVKKLKGAQKRVQNEMNSYTQKAKAAVLEGSDNRAKENTAKKNALAEQNKSLTTNITDAEAVVVALRDQVSVVNNKIKEMDIKKDTLAARMSVAKVQKEMSASLDGIDLGNDASGVLRRFEESVNQEESAAKVYTELAGENGTGEVVIDDAAVNEELDAMKRELN